MNSHTNAKLTARDREEMIRRLGTKSVATIAADYGLSKRTVRKWKHRYALGGIEALADADYRPKRCRCSLTMADMAQIHELRKGRKSGDEIALHLGLGRSTVYRALINWPFQAFFSESNWQFSLMRGTIRVICSIWI